MVCSGGSCRPIWIKQRPGDIKGFEKFCDLVRVPAVESHSELGAGTFNSLLVKKRVEASVVGIESDWLEEKVRTRVEADEMVHGIVDRDDGKVDGGKSRFGGNFNGWVYFGGSGGRSGDDKLPCSFCVENHGVWMRRKFQGLTSY